MTSNCVIVSIKLYQYVGYDEYRAVTLFYAILVGRSRSPLPYTVVGSKKINRLNRVKSWKNTKRRNAKQRGINEECEIIKNLTLLKIKQQLLLKVRMESC